MAAGYTAIMVWGLILLLLYTAVSRSLWKTGRLYMAVTVILFIAGAIRISVFEKPKEAFGYLAEEISVTARGEIKEVNTSASGVSITLTNTSVFYCGKEYFIDGLLVYISDISEAANGDIIAVSGNLSSFMLPHNDGEFDSYTHYKSLGIYYRMTDGGEPSVISRKRIMLGEALEGIKGRLTEGLFMYCYSPKDAGTMNAMLFGEKQYLDSELYESFKEGGIGHILTVSGLHVSLMGLGLYKLIRKIAGYGVSCFVSGCFVVLYVWLTGFGVSGQRALLMFLIMMTAEYIGRTYDMLSAIGASFICMLIRTPYLFLNCGFQLSFLSVLGISEIMPLIRTMFTCADKLRKRQTGVQTVGQIGVQAGGSASDKNAMNGVSSLLKEAFAFGISGLSSGIAAAWSTLPITAWYFYEYSLYSVFVNLFILPWMSVIVALGLGGVCGELLTGAGEALLKGPLHLLLLYYEKACKFTELLPDGKIVFGRPSVKQLICAYTMLFAVCCVYMICMQLKKRGVMRLKAFERGLPRFAAAVAVTVTVSLAEIWLLLPGNGGGLTVTMLDVGQGEAIFMELPTGENVLLDAGSTSVKNLYDRRILPFLRAHVVRTLDYVIVSHADYDHCAAIRELLSEEDGIAVKRLVLPELGAEDEGIAELMRLGEQKGCEIIYLSAGDSISIGKVSLMCLNPDYGGSTGSFDRNSMSIVLHLKYGRFDMLFTGDIRSGDEERLLCAVAECEVLKVAHHGSAYSNSEAFINAVSPSLSIISSGKNNIYGHPHAECIERLSGIGSDILITAVTGQITIITDGVSYGVRCRSR